MDERKRAKDVPGGAGASDPGQVPGQEKYGEPPVGETPKPDPGTTPPTQPPDQDEDEGEDEDVGGKEVGDAPTAD